MTSFFVWLDTVTAENVLLASMLILASLAMVDIVADVLEGGRSGGPE